MTVFSLIQIHIDTNDTDLVQAKSIWSESKQPFEDFEDSVPHEEWAPDSSELVIFSEFLTEEL